MCWFKKIVYMTLNLGMYSIVAEVNKEHHAKIS